MHAALVSTPYAERPGSGILRAQALRSQIEASLEDRFPGALTPAPRQLREIRATGIEALDAMLEGGLPVGAITELVGPLSSGRTGVAFSAVAEAMREGSMCAWIDASDAFDPESAAANGVRLEQLLWVRCGIPGVANTGNVAQGVKQQGSRQQAEQAGTAYSGRAGQHPRDEVRGLDAAVGELLRRGDEQDRGANGKPGTPGASNRPLEPAGRVAGREGAGSETCFTVANGTVANGTLANGIVANEAGTHRTIAHGAKGHSAGAGSSSGPARLPDRQPGRAGTSSASQRSAFRPVPREEQVSSDRQPKRGRTGLAAHQPGQTQPDRVADPQFRPVRQSTNQPGTGSGGPAARPMSTWARLDQALRAADLLLQAGGFRVLVLDLGSVAPEHALRIPLATWFRFRAAADTHRTLLIALTQTSCARSSAGLVVHFEPLEAQTAGAEPVMPDANGRLVPGLTGSELVGPLAGPHLVKTAQPRRAASLIESMRYHARPLRQRFTPGPQPVARPSSGKRASQASWQLSAYPVREQA